MKILIINKSDSTGGAAVVSFRMMQALRQEGHDARMLVAERLTDSPYVDLAASPLRLRAAFLRERLGIAFANRFNRSTLFQIDTASAGLPVWSHPWYKDADVILLNWVNQGLLSLKGIKKICQSGKRVAWIMHDMWCATGICHHAHQCSKYQSLCHACPLLQRSMETTLPSVVNTGADNTGADKDLSTRTQARKRALYRSSDILFIPVSHWLADVAHASTLLKDRRIEVIPNPFPIEPYLPRPDRAPDAPIRILFGAARLDDPIKGLPILIAATKWLKEHHPDFATRCELTTFGNVKDPSALDGIAIPVRHLGRVAPDQIRALYEGSDIVVSTSRFETLPGTLVEGQAYGAVPVAFLRGGQADIIDHLHTGFLARWSDDESEAAASIAEGILWAAGQSEPTRQAMHSSASRFSYQNIASRILSLLLSLLLFILPSCAQSKFQGEDSTATRDNHYTLSSESHTLKNTTPPDSVTFAFVGDMMLGTTFPEDADYLPANEGRNLFDACRQILRRADIAAGNCEGTIAIGGKVKQCRDSTLCYAFRQPPYMAERYAEAGFDILNLANNHINDFGPSGISQTIKNLQDQGIAVMGLRKEAPTAIIERNGLKIGFAGFAPGAKALDINNYEELKRVVKDLKSRCDIVVVSMHGGAEGAKYTEVPRKMEIFHGEKRGDVYKFAHTAIDAGADVVWGHGPHVPRPIEVYKDRLIMYSLGNFCTPFRVNISGISGQAPLVEVSLNPDGSLRRHTIHPFRQQKAAGPVPAE